MLEKKRDAEIEARAKKLETDLAELEAEGAKSDVRRKVREGGDREMRQIRDRAQREIDRLDEVLDTFRKLDVKQLISDELLYRELRDRFGEYFEGGMGAEALQTLLQNFDLEAEAQTPARDDSHGQGAEEAAGPQAAESRRVVPEHHEFAARHGARLRSGDPAGPAPDGAVRRWPVRHLGPERPVPPRDQPQQPT